MVEMNKVKNVLICGCGGVSGFIVDVLAHLIKNAQIPDDILFTCIDYDRVEEKNILYQNFLETDITTNKAVALEQRYSPYFFGIDGKIDNEEQLAKYDMFIVGADSNKCRKLVAEHCHKTGKPFIDARSEGASSYIYTDTEGWELEEYIKTLGDVNQEGGSCQLPFMLENKQIDLGNRIVAPKVAQILLNRFRGLSYPKIINETI